jgi:hypothetical protein
MQNQTKTKPREYYGVKHNDLAKIHENDNECTGVDMFSFLAYLWI